MSRISLNTPVNVPVASASTLVSPRMIWPNMPVVEKFVTEPGQLTVPNPTHPPGAITDAYAAGARAMRASIPPSAMPQSRLEFFSTMGLFGLPPQKLRQNIVLQSIRELAPERKLTVSRIDNYSLAAFATPPIRALPRGPGAAGAATGRRSPGSATPRCLAQAHAEPRGAAQK